MLYIILFLIILIKFQRNWYKKLVFTDQMSSCIINMKLFKTQSDKGNENVIV